MVFAWLNFNSLRVRAAMVAALHLTVAPGWGAEPVTSTILRDTAEGVSALISGVTTVETAAMVFEFAAQHAAVRGRLERAEEQSLRLTLTVTPRKTAFKETTFILETDSLFAGVDAGAIAAGPIANTNANANRKPRRFEVTQGGLRIVGCLHFVAVPGTLNHVVSAAIEVTPGLGRDLAPGPSASCSVNDTGRGLAVRLSASDPDDPNPAIWLLDTLSGFQAGPFRNGDVVLLTINASTRLERRQQKGAGEYTAFLKFQGEPLIFAVNADNISSDPSLCR